MLLLSATAMENMSLPDFHVSTTGLTDFLNGCRVHTNSLYLMYDSHDCSCFVPTYCVFQVLILQFLWISFCFLPYRSVGFRGFFPIFMTTSVVVEKRSSVSCSTFFLSHPGLEPVMAEFIECLGRSKTWARDNVWSPFRSRFFNSTRNLRLMRRL